MNAPAKSWRLAILDALAAGPGSADEIAARAGRPLSRIRTELCRLRDDGLVSSEAGPSARLVWSIVAPAPTRARRGHPRVRRGGLMPAIIDQLRELAAWMERHPDVEVFYAATAYDGPHVQIAVDSAGGLPPGEWTWEAIGRRPHWRGQVDGVTVIWVGAGVEVLRG